jgi:hypothetical protein
VGGRHHVHPEDPGHDGQHNGHHRRDAEEGRQATNGCSHGQFLLSVMGGSANSERASGQRRPQMSGRQGNGGHK